MSESHAPARGAATLHDVAREAGVSLATASRVLNGSTRKVAESYRERVEAAAEKLGYTANLAAQATARGNTAMVALLVADIADPYFGELAAGVGRGADETGLMMTIGITDRDEQREARLVRALRGQRPRGLILASSRTAGPDAAGLAAELETFAGIGRVVSVGEGAPVERTVSIDNRGGAAALGAELARIGYRDAVVVAAAEGVRLSDDRVAGFTEGFTAGGGSPPAVHHAGFSRDAGFEAARELLSAGSLSDGTVIFGVTDVIAIGVMAALRDAGRDVGREVAVAGFDDIAAARDIHPGLTTVRVPLEELGHRALRAAVDTEWTPDADPALSLEVVLRGSTPSRG
ncbi:LacI family DNA-binding transcriptional regulator [Microbacterium sp. NPDC057407]|uniref:LacI family DNA-binding transcriptional regulator n=1 Tax=Microbacterium sp. NPDC057407 TaxID=3346120 RepID=UPI00367188BB